MILSSPYDFDETNLFFITFPAPEIFSIVAYNPCYCDPTDKEPGMKCKFG